ncbi:MAG TPA: DUF1565 domain-containing protein [Armatimonadota bacterium]
MTIRYFHPSIALMALAALLFGAPAARAAVWYVAITGNDANAGTLASPLRTIGKGIAKSTNGDTVLVADGTYNETNLDFGSTNLVLRSQSGNRAACILDCQRLGPAIRIAGGQASAAVSSMTIKNAYATTNHIGAGLYIRSSTVSVTNCIFSGNEFHVLGLGADAIYVDYGGNAAIADCGFSGNGGYTGTVLALAAGNTTVKNCTFSNNTTSAIGHFGGACTATRCTFSGNFGNVGGAMDIQGGSMTATGCLFLSNQSVNFNSQIFLSPGSLTLNDSLFVGATSTSMAAEVQGGAASFTNCTFVGASALLRVQVNGQIAMANSIVWGASVAVSGVYALSGTTATVTYSDVSGGYSGTGNFTRDPVFVNAAAGNYRLQSTSPCINVASAAAPNLPAIDLDGAPRIIGAAPDMGAYEFLSSTPPLWFVDAGLGNDTTGTGSPSAPYKTVTKVISVAGPGQSVYIMRGNYGSDRPRITKSLRFYNWFDTGWARIGKP